MTRRILQAAFLLLVPSLLGSIRPVVAQAPDPATMDEDALVAMMAAKIRQ